jgi:hypothetical protein
MSKLLTQKRIGWFVARELTGKGKARRKRMQEKSKKQRQAEIAVFGKTRYWLAQLFGQWVLYV